MFNWKAFVPEFVVMQWDTWFKKVENSLIYFTPAYVSKTNTFFSPLVAVIAIIMTIVMLGTALGSFFVLFTSLLVLYFILTKIFGINLEAGDVFVV